MGLLRRIAANIGNISQSRHSGQRYPADMVTFNDPARQALTLGFDQVSMPVKVEDRGKV
jgi:hypothetical protein